MSSTLKIGKNEITDKVNNLIARKKQLEDKLVATQVSMLDLNIEQIAKESVSISDIYSNDLENWNVKQGVSERSVNEVREHANAPKFCGANSSNHLIIQFIYKLVHNLDTKVLRLSAQRIVDKSDNLVIVYIGMPDLQGKLSITIAVSKETSNKVHAGNLAKEVSVFLGGSGGGGQANIAQAGGTDVSKVGKLQDMIRELLSKF